MPYSVVVQAAMVRRVSSCMMRWTSKPAKVNRSMCEDEFPEQIFRTIIVFLFIYDSGLQFSTQSGEDPNYLTDSDCGTNHPTGFNESHDSFSNKN
jgi:hypothetical protein